MERRASAHVRDCKLLKRMVVKEYGKRWYEGGTKLNFVNFTFGAPFRGTVSTESFKTRLSRPEILNMVFSHSDLSREITIWINQQTEESLQQASVKTVREVLREKFSIDGKFPKPEKDFIKATTIVALQKRTKEIEAAKNMKKQVFSSDSDSDSDDDIPIAQKVAAAKTHTKKKTKKKTGKKTSKSKGIAKVEQEEEGDKKAPEEDEEDESAFEGDAEEEEDSDDDNNTQAPPASKRRKKTNAGSLKQHAAADAEEEEEIVETIVDTTQYDEETPDIYFAATEAAENVEIYRESPENKVPWSVTLHHPDFNKYVRLQLIAHKTNNKMWLLTREGTVKSTNPKVTISAIPKRRGVSKFQDMYLTKTGHQWSAATQEEEVDANGSTSNNKLYVRVLDVNQLPNILRKPDVKKRKRSSPRKTSSSPASSSPSPNKRSRTGDNPTIFSSDENLSASSSDTSDESSSSEEDEETTLDERIVTLLKKTADTKAIHQLLSEKNCNHPIKKLTRALINRGFETLRDLEKVIKYQKGDQSDEDDKNETLVAHSETFYKTIKHDYDIDPQVCSVMYPIDSLPVRSCCYKRIGRNSY